MKKRKYTSILPSINAGGGGHIMFPERSSSIQDKNTGGQKHQITLIK